MRGAPLHDIRCGREIVAQLTLAPARLAEPPLTVQLRKERTIGATRRALAFPIVKGTITESIAGVCRAARSTYCFFKLLNRIC